MSVELMLERLTRQLHHRLKSIEARQPIFVNLQPLQQAVAEISERVGGDNSPAQHRDRLAEALNLLRTRGPEVALRSHVRYVCWALCEPAGTPSRRVLDEQHLLPNTLAVLREAYGDALLRPNVWRGLLDAYLRFAPPAGQSIGRDNWLQLRTLLADTLDPLYARARFRPTWLERLHEHANLLGDEPCTRYGAAALDATDPVLAQLRTDLQIPETSWFWSELLLAQVRVVTARDDAGFLAHLDVLLSRVTERPAIRDHGLAALLERYAASGRRAQVHAVLRDTVSDAWGSPHLERNTRWALTTPDAHQMVRTWLVVDALETFFMLLQEDRAADTRRLEFWLRYKSSIDLFHFCLNSQTYHSQSLDYKKFRSKYHELISLFRDASTSGNAFIFRINGYYVVEFGGIGATYIYPENNIPFSLNMRKLSTDQLKDKSKIVARLIHNGAWEHGFAYDLQKLGIVPDKERRTSHPVGSPSGRSGAGANQIQTGQPGPASGKNVDTISSRNPDQNQVVLWSVADVIAHAQAKAIGIEDNRNKGGALWVAHDRFTDSFAEQLARLGFKYVQNRGWWKK
ncbi:EH signature protein [Plasticicumulans lactativorans]|uniref:EH signature protein n=1 Tax=Plasticicumulans lactativorans TaxID=1133106 RepID=A0A4R2L8H1_9GAMM|nr:EH signature domain-containing protein [Plasticicumulans lactativorans]TCO82352.1 EH signature protein [Plasticicumulans lactativorans]